jgi:nicotinamide mononucleotide transporter
MIIEILAASIGLIYGILEYRASWWLWVAGMAMSLLYIYIFAEANCYAWAATYLYYLGANVYGIIIWKKNNAADSEGISYLPKKHYPLISALIFSLTCFFFIIIYNFTDSTIPISESLSSALSVIGMWLLAKKYVQHWYIWLVVNAIYAIANVSLGLYYSAILFAVYFVISMMGLARWRKLAFHHIKGVTPLE